MPSKAKYIIEDTFKITGRGIVLAGYIEEGGINIGDYIEFEAFSKMRKKKIVGIEGIRYSSPNKNNTGLLLACDNEDEIDELRLWRPKSVIGLISTE